MRLGSRASGAAKTLTKALAGAALLLLAPVQAHAQAAAPPAARTAAAAPRPAIWLLEDEDTKIYLFGTTHIFERGFRWRSPRLDAVVREADELVMETADEEEIDESTLAAGMFMTKPISILSRVSEARRARLAELIEESGLPVEAWDMLHSWAAAMMLMAMQMMPEKGADVRPLSGAEIELTRDFRLADKPISAVESSEQQMRIFQNLSLPAQRAFLESTIDSLSVQSSASGGADADGNVAWASGDVDAIARDMEELGPALYEALLTRRNRAWTEWLTKRLERPGTILFAVGAGHLAGRDSVQSMLAARGLQARRID